MKLKLKNNLKCRTKSFFTLLEMIVTLAVFLILIAVVLNFYDSIFKVSSSSRNSSDVFSNARTAMDIITRDIQCIYYKNGVTPFWHLSKKTAEIEFLDSKYHNDLIAFISATPLPQSSNITSKLCEVKYQLYNTNNYNDEYAGWILRSVTGDDSDSWNFQYNFNAGETGGLDCAFTADSSSSEDYQKLIPNVTSLSFECYDENGLPIYTSDHDIDFPVGDEIINPLQFPYSIRINLTLIDDVSWAKYRTATPNIQNQIRRQNSRTFSKTIFIGEHGQ